jgi:ribosomal protein S27AE
VEVNAPYGLRRGAWYPVLSVGPEEVVLVVRHRPVIVARSDVVDIVASQPNRWSVVAQESGTPYAVCPDCAERVALAAMAERMRCVRCKGWFEVERDLAGRKSRLGPGPSRLRSGRAVADQRRRALGSYKGNVT